MPLTWAYLAMPNAGVDLVGLLQEAHRLGETSHRARVDDRTGDARFPQEAEHHPLVSAGGLHHHQLDGVLAAKARRRSTPPWGVTSHLHQWTDRPARSRPSSVFPETSYSTNDVCHSNLPCACGWNQATVRSCVTSAAVPGLTFGCRQRGYGAPSAAARGTGCSRSPSPALFTSQSSANRQIQGG